MRFRQRVIVGLAAAVTASTAAVPSAWGTDATPIAVLASLPGDTGGTANGINDSGVAVGNSYGIRSQAVRWSDDGMVTALAAWPGDTASSANAVNASGVVVGDSSNTQGRHAVRWEADGSITDLGTLPDGRYASAEAVNASGVAAGYSYDSRFGQRAVRWGVDGVATDLGALPGDSESYAWGINSAGVIVGSSRGSGGMRPVRWDPDGTVTPLGKGNGAALAINDSGQITGYTNRNGLLDATLWSPDGSATTLVPAPGHTSGSVRINASGTIFGSSGTSSGGIRWHAAVWGADGVAQLLGDLSEGDTSVVRWTNGAHTSVGWATRGGVTYPVRWASNG